MLMMRVEDWNEQHQQHRDLFIINSFLCSHQRQHDTASSLELWGRVVNVVEGKRMNISTTHTHRIAYISNVLEMITGPGTTTKDK
jgi:hypothetical protein